ncbi:MAG: MOSC domain-containing protein [Azospirillum sp.]|nr:MOSC domain-containing protein [Azospirillum sp.]
MNAVVAKLYRYPVKGLSAQELDAVTLSPGECLPDDRRFALLQAAVGPDADLSVWHPKTHFLMLLRYERLALLTTDYEPDTATLSILRAGRLVARGRLDTPTGRTVVEQFFAAFMAGTPPGVPRLVESPGRVFSDAAEKYVSVINLASVLDLARVVKQPVDPLRFRANIYLDGVPAWTEAAWPGQVLRIGGCRLEVIEGIERCAATNVDPASGARDLNIPLSLKRGYGHCHCGVYARVVTGGSIAVGAAARLEGG